MIEVHSLKHETFETGKPYNIKVCCPSPLGNPFKIGPDGDRAAVCEKYADWLKAKLQDKNSSERLELIRLYYLYKEHGRLDLFCYCAPEQCHADFIKFVLNGGLKQ
jgi:hypothetical protein